MANVVVSAVCNRSCTYCFATAHLERSHTRQPQSGRSRFTRSPHNGRSAVDDLPATPTFLPLASYKERLDFLARSGIEEVRLLGGEPTLHPQFNELIRMGREAGLRVVVFSNGLVPEGVLAKLEALPPDQCTVLLNLTPPAGDGADGLWDRQVEALLRLGERAIPGVNVHRLDLDLEALLPLVIESGCKRTVRVGIAQPNLSGANEHIVPNQYRAVTVRLVRFARAAAKVGVCFDVDCGFVRCAFSDAELAELRGYGCVLEWRCNPILDIDLDGNVLHCFPLSELASLPMTADAEAAALRREFESRTSHYRRAGVFRECSACGYKASGRCTGGCLAVTMRRFRSAPFSVSAAVEGFAP